MASCCQYLILWLRLLCGWRASEIALISCAVLACSNSLSLAQPQMETFADEAFADLQFTESGELCDVCGPDAAKFGQWEDIVDESYVEWSSHELKPFDWIRHFGFRHSSTHGRHIGRGLPLEGSSLRNRPYHVDWFVGPLLGDDLINNRVSQQNVLFGGVRIGWDFDYYWGIEWRFGRADPEIQYAELQSNANEESYVVSDVDLVYYPWGDSKVRPYFLIGIGAAQIDFLDDADIYHDATLATMPMGGGVRFQQWPWLLWRLEILNNMSFGDDNISTLHTVSITAGMELRLGARPASYWPWRTSRKIW